MRLTFWQTVSAGVKCHAIGKFELTTLPGNQNVAVSHAVELFPSFRGKGLGHQFMQHRLKVAKELGYKALIATVVEGNGPEETCLIRAEWKQVGRFEYDNKIVGIWIKVL